MASNTAEGQINILVKAKDDATKVLQGVGGAMGNAAKAGAAVAAGAIAGIGVAAVGVGIKASTAFMDFQDSMNEVFTLLPGISASAMDEMEANTLKAAEGMGRLPNEVIPALYQALSAGVPEGNVFDFLDTAHKAALGGVTDIETAVDGMSSVVNAYGADVINAGQASDLMFTAVRLGKTTFGELSSSLSKVTPTAAAVGVGFENITAALATMTSQGTTTKMASTQLNSLLAELATGGTAVNDIFVELAGTGFQDFMDQGNDMQDVMILLSDYAEENGISFLDMFGSIDAAKAAMQLTGKGAESFAKNLDAMNNSAGATDAAFETMNKGLKRTWEVIQTKMVTNLIRLGDALSPLIEMVGNAMAGAVENLEAKLQQVLPYIQNVIFAFQKFFENLQNGQSPIEAFKNLVSKLMIVFGASVEDALAFQAAFDQVILAIQEFGEQVQLAIDAVVEFVTPIAEWIAQFVTLQDVLIALGIALTPIIFSIGVSAVSAMAAFVASAAPILLIVGGLIAAVSGLRYVWENDIGGIKTFLIEAWEGTIRPALQQLVEWFQTNIPVAIAAMVAFWEGTLEPAFKSAAAYISGTVVPALKVLAENVGEKLRAASQTLSDFWNNVLLPAITAVANFFNDVLIPILVALYDVHMAALDAIVRTVQGAWENVLLPALETVAAFIEDTVVPVITELYSDVMEAWNTVSEAVGEVWNEVIAPALQAVTDKIKTALQPALEGLNSFIKDKIQPVLESFGSWWDGLGEKVGTFQDKVQSLIDFLQKLKEKIDAIDWFKANGGGVDPDNPGGGGNGTDSAFGRGSNLPFGGGVPGASGAAINNGRYTTNYYTLSVGTTASGSDVIQSFEYMKALGVN